MPGWKQEHGKVLQFGVKWWLWVLSLLSSEFIGFMKMKVSSSVLSDFLQPCWIMGKGREFQKIIYFCFIDYAKAFDCVDHNQLWKILKEMGIPDHLTCLLRNLYAGQEAKLELDMEQQTASK